MQSRQPDNSKKAKFDRNVVKGARAARIQQNKWEQKSELLDPVVAEATLDFRNLNKRKLLTNFPTFLLQVDKTSLLRNGHGTYQSHLGDPEAKRCNCSFNGLSCKELQCFYKIDINGKGFARRMDVVWGEIAGVNGQLWLLAPILFILQ
ncbi:unnamed protein product [Camellia sinensis]